VILIKQSESDKKESKQEIDTPVIIGNKKAKITDKIVKVKDNKYKKCFIKK